jgi:hypothetical protein
MTAFIVWADSSGSCELETEEVSQVAMEVNTDLQFESCITCLYIFFNGNKYFEIGNWEIVQAFQTCVLKSILRLIEYCEKKEILTCNRISEMCLILHGLTINI